MKTIMTYGDSNAWGLIPTTKFERFELNKRWPGIIQSQLGPDVRVIEENLCARTIDSDDPRPGFENRNGMTELPMLLDSHYPVDVILVSLGLNELKSIYDWTPEQVGVKMLAMIEMIKARQPNFHTQDTQIVLMTQPIVENTGQWGELWIGAHDKSLELRQVYADVAARCGVPLLDVSDISVDTKDGVHYNQAAHKQVAERVVNFFT